MSKFNSHKWQKSYKEFILEKDEKVTLKDLLHTTKVDDKKADKVDVKIGAENDLAIEKDKDGNDVYAKGLTEAITKPYQLGDKWSEDFDYVGMLKLGANAPDINGENVDQMNELHASFEDVNYHTEARDLGNALDWLEDTGPDEPKVLQFMKMFRAACAQTLKDITRR